MSRTPMYDPKTSEARSSWLAGLTEACNKLSGILDMKTSTFEDVELPELYISEKDRYRIYQAPQGNKLWMSTPAPVIKKNGMIITPDNDGFEIDYLGGSIAFEEAYTLSASDVITASATYIVDGSNRISDILADIDKLTEDTGHSKGNYDTVEDLENAVSEPKPGDFAIITSEDTIYIWNDVKGKWVDVYKETDLSNYFTKSDIEGFLSQKEDNIPAKGTGSDAKNYFFAGDKTWVNLIDKILGATLSGLVTTDSSQIESTDTLLVALGKLQAQINGFIHPIIGSGAPTTSTVGVVGQDYINKSNGDKYRLVYIDIIEELGSPDVVYYYIWEKYGSVSKVEFTVTLPISSWSANKQTVTDSRLLSDNKYAYIIGPSEKSYTAYNDAVVHANDVTTDGQVTFVCTEVPTTALTANIMRLEGENNG